jgi:hypothetical protein
MGVGGATRRSRPPCRFDILSTQDGVKLPTMEEQREISVLRVGYAMRPPSVPVVGAEESVAYIHQSGADFPYPAVLVHNGTMPLQQVQTRLAEGVGL